MTDQGFRHDSRRRGRTGLGLWRAYRALLAVSEAIVSHRDLSALFHELADRLHEVVRFDYLGLVLHEAASQTMRLHILEGRESTPRPWVEFPVGELPEGLVWQTQQPLILADVAEETRWPRFLEQVRPLEAGAPASFR